MALVLAVVMAVEMVAPGPEPRRFPFCIGTCRSSWGRRATTGTRPRTWRSGGPSPRGSALLPPRRRKCRNPRCKPPALALALALARPRKGTCRSSWGRRATTGTRPRTWRSAGLSPRGSALLPPRRRMSHSRRCTEDRALFRQPPPSGPAGGPRALGLRVGTTGGPPGTGRLRRPCPFVSHRRRPRHPLKGPRLSR